MRITVQAHHPHHANLARGGRFWPTSAKVEVEVLNQEDDPPPIRTKTTNATTGLPQTVERPDPHRIGRATYRLLMADNRLTVKQGDSIAEAAADAAIGAARAAAGKAQDDLVKVQAEAAAELAKLQVRIDELFAENVAIKGELAEARLFIDSLKNPPPPAEGTATAEAEKGEKSDSKKSGGRK